MSIIYWLHSGTGSNIVLYNRNIMCIYGRGNKYRWLRAFFLFEPEVSLDHVDREIGLLQREIGKESDRPKGSK